MDEAAPVFGVMLLSGDMAVTAFFMVSGFLMALILETKYFGRVGSFYVNRILRIYPPYLVALAGSVAFFFLLGANPYHEPFTVLAWFLDAEAWPALAWSALTNLTLIGINLVRYIDFDQTGQFFVNAFEPGPVRGHNILFVPQAWTLSLELYYYALVPLVVLLRTRYIAAITALLFYLDHDALRYIASLGLDFSPASSFPFQLKYFLLGSLGFRFAAPIRALADRYRAFRLLPPISLVAGFILVFSGLPALRAWNFEMDWFYLAVAVCLPGMFICSNGWKIDAALGEYSYPVYLFHFTVKIGTYLWAPLEWHGELTVAITLLLAAAYIQLVDKRVEAVRRDIARNGIRRSRVAAPGVA